MKDGEKHCSACLDTIRSTRKRNCTCCKCIRRKENKKRNVYRRVWIKSYWRLEKGSKHIEEKVKGYWKKVKVLK